MNVGVVGLQVFNILSPCQQPGFIQHPTTKNLKTYMKMLIRETVAMAHIRELMATELCVVNKVSYARIIQTNLLHPVAFMETVVSIR